MSRGARVDWTSDKAAKLTFFLQKIDCASGLIVEELVPIWA